MVGLLEFGYNLRAFADQYPEKFRSVMLTVFPVLRQQPVEPLGLMNDDWIRSKCLPADAELDILEPMISPFHDRLITQSDDRTFRLKPGVELYPKKRLSFGVTGFGYDVTLAPTYKIFSAENALARSVSVIDPKRFDPAIYLECEAVDGVITMPAKSFILAKIHEYIRMPPNALAILLNKSTYARCGVTVTTTVMEPGWHGEIVVEITNDAPLPVRLYANEGIGQLIFLTGVQPREHYGSRNEGAGGKYQFQTGITEPRV